MMSDASLKKEESNGSGFRPTQLKRIKNGGGKKEEEEEEKARDCGSMLALQDS